MAFTEWHADSSMHLPGKSPPEKGVIWRSCSGWQEISTVPPPISSAMPDAVLTENFFMDNKQDVSYLLSLEGRTQIVKTHVDAIIKYVAKYGKA